VTRFVFEGEQFATRFDAERVRAEKIRAIARGFYVELPRALAQRKQDEQVELASSTESLAHPSASSSFDQLRMRNSFRPSP
jgi:hypothetical protein